jgi:hypothetical protein
MELPLDTQQAYIWEVATGWTAGIRFPAGARNFSFLHSVHTGSGTHPVYYPMDTGGSFWGPISRGVKLTTSI